MWPRILRVFLGPNGAHYFVSTDSTREMMPDTSLASPPRKETNPDDCGRANPRQEEVNSCTLYTSNVHIPKANKQDPTNGSDQGKP